MENNKLLSISIIILAISIIFGSIWIGNSLNEVSNQSFQTNLQKNDILDDILELDEAAKYLKISEGDLLYLIRGKDLGIKYVEINGKYIFSKEALYKWIGSTQLEIQR